MVTMSLNSYIHQIYDAWEKYNGIRIAELLSLTDPHVMSSKLLDDRWERKVEEDLPNPIADMVLLHFDVIKSIREGKMDQALQSQCQLGQGFCKVFQAQKEDNWGLPLMEKVCEDLRRVALSARVNEDQLSRSEENAPTCMEKAADVIMALFRVCAADTRTQEAETKRWGMLVLVNHLFKIYFRINRLQLCKPLIRAIEAQALKDRYPVSQMVTYKYYVGRKAMFDSEFKEADQCLTYAFQHSATRETYENKKKILSYLVPVKMFLGWLPTEEALRKYDLMEFLNVSKSLKDGNIRKFDAALKENEKIFIKAGVYLILEKLRMLLYRNLFKKVCQIHSNHQIPMGALEAALRWAGHEEIDLDETHCIVSNLIYDNRIRGYISHQHQILVLAKSNAFPKISQV